MLARADVVLDSGRFGQVTEVEIDAILAAFDHPREARENGLLIKNIAYHVVRADAWAVYAKNVLFCSPSCKAKKGQALTQACIN